jgi:hypothetical protein
MLHVDEVAEKTSNQSKGSQYQYRSSVANKICETLKNKFNRDLSIRGSVAVSKESEHREP